MSRQAYLIREFLLRNRIRERACGKSLLQRRAQDDLAMKAAIRPPRGVVTERTFAAGMPAMWVSSARAQENCKTILYLHGGGFFSGSCETHKGLAAAISEASGVRSLLVDYRLAPEFHYPAAHDDALAVYRWLLEDGIDADDILIAGDSAGGNLALATLLSARDEGLPLPAGAVLLSPWLDVLDCKGESYTSRAELDPSIDASCVLQDSRVYFGPDPDRHSVCLLERKLRGLPPLFVQVGDLEVLLSDSVILAERAEDTGVDVTLQVWPGMWHVFQAITAILPEAREAVAKVGAWVAMRLRMWEMDGQESSLY